MPILNYAIIQMKRNLVFLRLISNQRWGSNKNILTVDSGGVFYQARYLSPE